MQWGYKVLAFLILAGLLSACRGYMEFNPDSNVAIDFLANAHRLVFGTSTGDTDENRITIDEETGSVNLYARNNDNNAGKIAGSEDGITFLFKEVDADRNFRLSANVKVISYGGIGTQGETTSNGQEGFGLMARDYVPQYPGATMEDFLISTEYRAGSTGGSGNMVMAGAVKRGVRAAVRTGVTGSVDVITDPLLISDSSLSRIEWWPEEFADYSPYPTLEERPDFPVIGGTYLISLNKTNSGFDITITPPAEKGAVWEHTIQEPDCLTVINQSKYYVGFFAARAAEIVVSDISYYESDRQQDAPRLEPPPEILTPEFTILSPASNADENYKIYASANVKGYLSVKQNGQMVRDAEYRECQWITEPTSNAVEPFAFFDVPVYQLQEGKNSFIIVFYPAEGQQISSMTPLSRTFIVFRKSYFNKGTPLYVAPDGSKHNSGTAADPLDIKTAIDFVLPGQTIIMQKGVYELLSLEIPRYNNGRYGNTKRIAAAERDQVFIDFKKNIYAGGAVLWGNYWEVSGIHIRNTPDKKKGFNIKGNNNLIEWVKTYNNGDTGLQISGSSKEPKSMWPKNNTVRYCESYDNKDAAQTDADGFAAKLTVGEGNRFEWCLSHNNCDDGWDLFTKKETGAIGPVVIENCISYQNGLLMDGTPTQSGRNGFKLGGEGLAVTHTVSNCLAFQNGAHGFTSNSNPAIRLEYVTSFDNGGRFNAKSGADSRNFTIYNHAGVILGLPATITGLLSLYSDPVLSDGTNRSEDKIQLKLPADGYVWYGEGTGSSRGTATRDFNHSILTVADVLETTPPLWDETFTTSAAPRDLPDVGVVSIGYIKRRPDGTFDLGDFMRLAGGAVMMPAGCVFD